MATLLAGMISLAGCGIAPPGTTGAIAGTSNVTGLHGSLYGGQQPLSGSHVYLLAAGYGGYGSASVSLLTGSSANAGGTGTDAAGNSYVITDASGNFTLTGGYTCTQGQQVYISTLGGNPGLPSGSNNPAIANLAALGTCPSSGVFPANQFITVNEVTTVAMVGSLASFMSGPQNVGVPSGDATAINALVAAFANAGNYANISSGQALTYTPDATGIVPTQTINTLADILAACINSTGATSTNVNNVIILQPCGTLFANATSDGTSTGTVPSDTVTAMLNIALNPTANVSALFSLVTPVSPFANALSSAPASLALPIATAPPILTSLSPSSGPAGVAQQVFIQGTNFNSTSTVSVSGVNISGGTQFIDNNTLSVSVPSSNFGQVKTYNVTVASTSTGLTSNSLPFTAYSASGTPLTLSPIGVFAGTTSQVVTIKGAGFLSTSTVQVNGATRTASYQSATTMYVTLTAADLAVYGSLTISVTTPGTGISQLAPFTIYPSGPIILQVSPAQFQAGQGATSLQVTGENVQCPNAVLVVNGTALITSPSGSNLIYATVPATTLAVPGTVSVVVKCPVDSPTLSAPVSIPIVALAPTLTTISPATGPINTAITVGLSGANFTNASTVLLNGVSVPISYYSSTYLSVRVPAASFITAGNYTFQVVTPGIYGGSTSTLNFNAYQATSVLVASPASVISGSGNTTVTVNGANFTTSSVVSLGGTALSTTFLNADQLTAVVPAAQLTAMGWKPLTVSTPAPGGTAWSPIAFYIYSVLKVGVLDIVYSPYTGKIIAGGNGFVPASGIYPGIFAVTPQTATFSAPLFTIGGNYNVLALSADETMLYSLDDTVAFSLTSYNMTTLKTGATIKLPGTYSLTNPPRSMAIQPGTNNVLAVDLGNYNGIGLFGFNTTANTGAIVGQYTRSPSVTSLQFVDSTNLYGADSTSGRLDHYTVPNTGFVGANSYDTYPAIALNDLKLDGTTGYSTNGAVIDVSTTPPTQTGSFTFPSSDGVGTRDVAGDSSLKRAFYVVSSGGGSAPSAALDTIAAFDQTTFTASGTLPINFSATETYAFSVTNLIRWGQDGLAAATSTGNLYLLRGPIVVPQFLATNTAPVLTSASSSTLAVGSPNTLLTLTGSNFIPGVAATWNGSYRTTRIVDATHVTMAIPTTDLAAAGSASIVLTNPGSPASSTLTETIQ